MEKEPYLTEEKMKKCRYCNTPSGKYPLCADCYYKVIKEYEGYKTK